MSSYASRRLEQVPLLGRIKNHKHGIIIYVILVGRYLLFKISPSCFWSFQCLPGVPNCLDKYLG